MPVKPYKIRAGFIQTKPIFGETEENIKNVTKKFKKIDADIIVLPELFNTGYNFRTKRELMPLAEAIDGKTVKGLQNIAKQKDMCIVAGIAEKDNGKIYNSGAMITRDKVNIYRKTHLFGNEKNIFEPGNTGFNVFDFKGAKIGMMVCFDWFFPESARTLALKGCDLIAHPANLVLPYCPDAMRTRANENRVFTITCDRIGTEKNLAFIGMSQITDTKGNVLYRASKDKEETKVLEINIEDARNKKVTEKNDLLKDRRIEMYKL